MGMGSSSQDLLIIFNTELSVISSKVSKGFPVKEISGQVVEFGGKKILMVQIFSEKMFRRSSESGVE